MGSQSTPIILIASEHWLMGKMLTNGVRILDVLNDLNTDYLHVRDVQVFRGHDRETRIALLPLTVVPKEKLSLAVIPSRKHEVPKTKRLHTIVEKKTSHIFAVVSGYSIQGELHQTSREEDTMYALHTLTHDEGQFFPVTQATVSRAGVQPLAAPVVMMNKSLVSCFYVGEAAPA